MRNPVIIYDAMCTAIADCHRIDEVKDLRDKAMALELYAKQAKNFEAERKASQIRLRAERRTGELLKDLPRAAPEQRNTMGSNQHKEVTPNDAEKPTSTPSPYAKALAETGISTQTASRYQALANVPGGLDSVTSVSSVWRSRLVNVSAPPIPSFPLTRPGALTPMT